MPGDRFFWGYDNKIDRAYGSTSIDGSKAKYYCKWVIINLMMQVTAVILFREDRRDIAEALDHVASVSPAGRIASMDIQASAIVPRKRIRSQDLQKRRRDYLLTDQAERRTITAHIRRRIVPEIAKIHQFAAIRIERHLVACDAAEDEARFGLHRDNATKGLAHRWFAVSIDLSEDFDGGAVVSPEYRARGYRPAAGGAVGFSRSLLHAVPQVTRRRRYAFLPFLYDDTAAQIREQITQFVEEP